MAEGNLKISQPRSILSLALKAEKLRYAVPYLIRRTKVKQAAEIAQEKQVESEPASGKGSKYHLKQRQRYQESLRHDPKESTLTKLVETAPRQELLDLLKRAKHPMSFLTKLET